MAVKLLRLKSGEDIVGEVVRENEELISISNPAILMPVSQSPGRQDQIQIGLAPWIPFSEEKEFKLPRDWILLTTIPAQDIVNNYNQIFGSGIVVPQYLIQIFDYNYSLYLVRVLLLTVSNLSAT